MHLSDCITRQAKELFRGFQLFVTLCITSAIFMVYGCTKKENVANAIIVDTTTAVSIQIGTGAFPRKAIKLKSLADSTIQIEKIQYSNGAIASSISTFHVFDKISPEMPTVFRRKLESDNKKFTTMFDSLKSEGRRILWDTIRAESLIYKEQWRPPPGGIDLSMDRFGNSSAPIISYRYREIKIRIATPSRFSISPQEEIIIPLENFFPSLSEVEMNDGYTRNIGLTCFPPCMATPVNQTGSQP